MKKNVENKENKNGKKANKYLLVLSLLVLLALVGTSFAYFSARVSKIRETQTKIQTNELDLIYTGVGEIDYSSMIPGDRFVKTFTVENTSNRPVSFNVYMQNILNELNEDLVFVLVETDASGNELTTVTSETPLPETNAGKSYLAREIEINASTIKYYKLKVEYKYTDEPQNDYQGKRFTATLGIDSNAVTNLSATINASDVGYTNSNSECEDVGCAVNELYDEIVGA